MDICSLRNNILLRCKLTLDLLLFYVYIMHHMYYMFMYAFCKIVDSKF
jgi:hypothetical protein